MSALAQTARSLWRTPAFTVPAVLTMGLGIAATTALFSVVHAVLLQPLPYPDSNRVVALGTSWPKDGKTTNRMTGGDLVELRPQATDLEALARYWGGEIGVRLGDRSHFVQTIFTSLEFFRVLGVPPQAGRFPLPAEAGRSAVVSLGFANANFGSSAEALGKTVTIDNKLYSVTGVLANLYSFPEGTEIWVVQGSTPENIDRTAFNYQAIARIRPQVGIGQAVKQLMTIAGRLARSYPASNGGKTFTLTPLRDRIAAPVRETLLFLFAGSGLLLLIACASIAHLSLARTVRKSRELAIRVSLGETVGNAFENVLIESSILALGSAAIGVFCAYAGLHLFLPLVPVTLPHVHNAVQMDASVVLFAVAVAFLTIFLTNLAPVTATRRADLVDFLKQSAGRGLTGGRGTGRDSIVVAQLAVCTVLCVGAALLAQTVFALNRTSLGVAGDHVLVMYADFPASTMPEYLRAIRIFEQILYRIRQLPGVRSAAAVMGLPAGHYGSNGAYLVEGVHVQPGQDISKMDWPRNLPYATFALASSNYFSTVGIHLLAGRDFTLRDQYDAPFTAVVSESLARQSFGSSSPIGRRIYCGLDSPKAMTIVGVVGDVRQDSPADPPQPEIYMPFQQHPYYANELQIVARTAGDPVRFAPVLRQVVHRMAPVVATRFTTFDEMVQTSVAAQRLRAVLVEVFAVFAILLAVGGVYALMSFQVAERTAEIGIRMAVGADPVRIMELVWRRAIVLAGVGLLLGTALSVALSRFVAGFLFGVTALDGIAYGAGLAVMLAVAICAAALPAWRAAHIDPVHALQQQG